MAGPSNRRPGSRPVDGVHLREYANQHQSPTQRITTFLKDTDGVSRSDISGATGLSWATIHKVLNVLREDGHLIIESTATPEAYRWRD